MPSANLAYNEEMKMPKIQLRYFIAPVLIASVAISCRTPDDTSSPHTLPELYSGEKPLDHARLLPMPSPTPTLPPQPIVMTVPVPENFPNHLKPGQTPSKKSKGKPAKTAADVPPVAPVTPPASAQPVSPQPQASPSASPASINLTIPDSEEYRSCKLEEVKPNSMSREQAYSTALFQPGEKATYEVFYGGVLGGYGSIEVDNPTLIDGLWHRVLKAEASTGDWFKSIFVGKYKILSWSRPWDFGIRRFFMETDEGKLFGSRTALKKWVEFDHGSCAGHERTLKNKNPEKLVDTFFQRSSTDVLGAYFALRTRNYKIGRIERVPVYTGEKNWSLEATPIAQEDVETSAGKFPATRLKLQTYIGQELQQKGDVHIWIAESMKERIMVQVKADVKVGSIYVKLKEFRPGGL
jgi:hypothetical protein